ncbi:MAG: archaellin/type IV pilin N-terminal domain-containing protein [Thermoprotei archaeon]|jgi:flagellin-like protein
MHIKTLKNKKAVSPIIATLILILIAVAAGVIVYVWTTSYIGQQVGILSQEQFVITKVKYYVSGSSKLLDVTIINQGSTTVNITSAKVYDASYSSQEASMSSPASFDISPGETKTQTLTLNAALTKGQEYIFYFLLFCCMIVCSLFWG